MANLQSNDALFLPVFCSSHCHRFINPSTQSPSIFITINTFKSSERKTCSLSFVLCFCKSCGLRNRLLSVEITRAAYAAARTVWYRCVWLPGSPIGSLGGPKSNSDLFRAVSNYVLSSSHSTQCTTHSNTAKYMSSFNYQHRRAVLFNRQGLSDFLPILPSPL